MNRKIPNNIPKLYLIKISKWFMLFMPYIVPFYESNGLSMHKIMILQAIYSLAIVVFEMPSGYVADLWGRKNSITLGSLLALAGFVIYTQSYGFYEFLVAEIILGLGQSFISGSDSAMLYDTLADMKKERQYMKYEGRMVSLGNVAEASAGVLAGVIITISLRANYYFQTGVAFMALPAALLLVEPYSHKALVSRSFQKFFRIFHHALFVNRDLQRNILFSSLIGCATLTMAWFVQRYFEAVELPLTLFGLMWTLLNLTVGIAAIFAYRLEHRLGQVRSVILITLLIPAGYFLVGSVQALWAIVFLFVFYLVRGFATPVLKDYIQQITESQTRATVLSIRNFIIRLNFVIVGPALGWLTDNASLSAALLTGGIFFLVFGSFLSALYLVSLKR